MTTKLSPHCQVFSSWSLLYWYLVGPLPTCDMILWQLFCLGPLLVIFLGSWLYSRYPGDVFQRILARYYAELIRDNYDLFIFYNIFYFKEIKVHHESKWQKYRCTIVSSSQLCNNSPRVRASRKLHQMDKKGLGSNAGYLLCGLGQVTKAFYALFPNCNVRITIAASCIGLLRNLNETMQTEQRKICLRVTMFQILILLKA